MNSGQESISTIIDSLNSLSDNPTNTDSDQESNTKTCTVDDIVNKRLNSLEDYVNAIINIYQRPWNKLEQKLKLKKLEEYYEEGPGVDSSEEDESTSKRKKNMLKHFQTLLMVKLNNY